MFVSSIRPYINPLNLIPLYTTSADVRLRIHFWLWTTALYIGAIAVEQLYPQQTFLVFFLMTATSYQVLKDYFSSVPLRHIDRLALLWSYFAVPVQVYFAHQYLTNYAAPQTHFFEASLFFIPLFMLIGVPFFMHRGQRLYSFLSPKDHALTTRHAWIRFAQSLATIQWGLLATVYAMTQVTFRWLMPAQVNPLLAGLSFLCCLMIFEWVNRRMGVYAQSY
ncbi:MAG: hypothetical protein AAF639_33195 [Chloroflexota bacterium]